MSKKLIERFTKQLLSLTKKDKVAVIHHTDPDGVSSGVLIAKAIQRVRGKKPDFRIHQKGNEISINKKTADKIIKKKITHVFIVDLSCDQQPEQLFRMAKRSKLIILDHHKLYNPLRHKNILLIKSQMISKRDPARYCAAKLTYDLASNAVNISDLDWVASLGIIGDVAYPMWRPFLAKVMKRYGIKFKKNPFDTELGKACSMISLTEAYDWRKVKESYNVVWKATHYKDILRSNLRTYAKKVAKEISRCIDQYPKKAELHKELSLAFYLIKSKYVVKSQISTILSFKNPHTTMLLMQDAGEGMITISARRQDRHVAVNDLLENCVGGLHNATAGGHIPAAGGNIRKQDLQKFKKRVLHALKRRQKR